MLWRKNYVTRMIRNPNETPSLSGVSLLGEPFDILDKRLLLIAFSPDHLLDFEIWHRLVATEFPGQNWLAQGIVANAATSEVGPLIKPSLHAITYIWTGVIPAECQTGQTLAWCPKTNLSVLGPPTEDAWEDVCRDLAATS